MVCHYMGSNAAPDLADRVAAATTTYHLAVRLHLNHFRSETNVSQSPLKIYPCTVLLL